MIKIPSVQPGIIHRLGHGTQWFPHNCCGGEVLCLFFPREWRLVDWLLLYWLPRDGSLVGVGSIIVVPKLKTLAGFKSC